VTIPAVVLNRGTVIMVTNATMAINGDTSSVQALVANPGPDGISLQEAIIATNNDPGMWNIQFASALKGSTIVVDTGSNIPGLSPLSGGNVTINGDIDGDGLPDITLTSQSGTGTGFFRLVRRQHPLRAGSPELWDLCSDQASIRGHRDHVLQHHHQQHGDDEHPK
jgi:hypothetical protein